MPLSPGNLYIQPRRGTATLLDG